MSHHQSALPLFPVRPGFKLSLVVPGKQKVCRWIASTIMKQAHCHRFPKFFRFSRLMDMTQARSRAFLHCRFHDPLFSGLSSQNGWALRFLTRAGMKRAERVRRRFLSLLDLAFGSKEFR